MLATMYLSWLEAQSRYMPTVLVDFLWSNLSNTRYAQREHY
jgi:hypothetical protein